MRKNISRIKLRSLIIEEYKKNARQKILIENIGIKRNNVFLRKIQMLERKGFNGKQIDIILSEDLKQYVKKAQDIYGKASDIYDKGEEYLGYGQQAVDVAKQISDFTGVKPQDLGIDIDLESINLDPKELINKLLQNLGLEEAKEWLGGKVAAMLEIPQDSLTMDIIKKVMVKFDIEDIIDVATGQANCDDITQKLCAGLGDGLLMMGLGYVDQKLKEEFPIVGSLFNSVEDFASNFLGIELLGEDNTSSPLVAKLYELIGPKMEDLICKRQLNQKSLNVISKEPEIEKTKGEQNIPIEEPDSNLKEIFLMSNKKRFNNIRKNQAII